MRKFLWILLAFPVIFGSCRHYFGKRVKGDGNIKTEDRAVGTFKNVDVSGAAKVYVSNGSPCAVKIEGDQNLLQFIEVSQEGDQIRVREKKGFHLMPTNELRIYVTAPVYNRIEASGACDILGQNKITNSENLDLHVSGAGDIQMEVDAPKLAAEVSGSGNINLKGQTKDVSLDLTGSGHAHCYELLAENVKVDITGAGSAEVYASVKLDADVSGAGSVNYKGNATSVSQHIAGAGSVSKVN
ncbi:head GIN domain-containing protein [Flavitalea flava]